MSSNKKIDFNVDDIIAKLIFYLTFELKIKKKLLISLKLFIYIVLNPIK